MNHLDDDAELYALGMTESDRAVSIEAHLAECGECRTRVAAAESVVASLAGALPAMPASVAVISPRRRSWLAPLATAAALVFAVTAGFEGTVAHSTSVQLANTDSALVAIASSHFSHTTLVADSGVVAKAIYARDGAWCYVVAENVPANSHLVMYQGGAAHDLGAFASGTPATLFVRGAGRVDRMEVVSNGHVVAHGAPVY